MKSHLKFIAVLVGFLAFNNSILAVEKPFFNLKVTEEKTLFIQVTEVVSDALEISIQKKNGEVLFSEYSLNNNFERKYNLSELADGSYLLIVKIDGQIQQIDVSISDDGLSIDMNQLASL